MEKDGTIHFDSLLIWFIAHQHHSARKLNFLLLFLHLRLDLSSLLFILFCFNSKSRDKRVSHLCFSHNDFERLEVLIFYGNTLRAFRKHKKLFSWWERYETRSSFMTPTGTQRRLLYISCQNGMWFSMNYVQ